MNPEQFKKAGWKFRLQFFVKFQRTGRCKFVKLLLQRVTDSLDSLEIVLPGLCDNVAGKLRYRFRSGSIRPDLKGVLAFQFEEKSNFLQCLSQGFARHITRPN